MNNTLLENKRGFTLIELIVTMAILSIVVGVIYTMFNYENKVFNNSYTKTQVQDYTRFAVDAVTKEIGYTANLTILDVTTCKNNISQNKPYNYIYVEAGTMHKSIYNSDTLPRTESIIGGESGLISSTVDVFNKIALKNNSLGINILGVKNTISYQVSSNIILKNFVILKSKPVVMGSNSGMAIQYSNTDVPITLLTNLTIGDHNNANIINTSNGSLQMEVKTFLPSNATNTDVIWSVVSGTGNAKIDYRGTLTALTNGTITVVAIANDGSKVTGSKVITLFNQPVLVTGITVTGYRGAVVSKRAESPIRFICTCKYPCGVNFIV